MNNKQILKNFNMNSENLKWNLLWSYLLYSLTVKIVAAALLLLFTEFSFSLVYGPVPTIKTGPRGRTQRLDDGLATQDLDQEKQASSLHPASVPKRHI